MVDIESSRRQLEVDAHPYIPNSAAPIRSRMLAELGIEDEEELFSAVPDRIRFRGTLALPKGIEGEFELRNHLEQILGRNQHVGEVSSFLGGGASRHFIPAVCDEIAARGEFLTAYHDGPSSVAGSYQAQFEFQSMIGSLVGMDMVSTTTYDWGSAAASSLLMAAQITSRSTVLVAGAVSPIRQAQIRTLAGPAVSARGAAIDERTGGVDVANLAKAMTPDIAAIYVEIPSYLGTLEPRIREIAEIAHGNGSLLVVGVNPISLGILAAPASYGADIVCGDIQPFGIHMYQGGGLAGFIATRDEQAFVQECPTLLVSALPTSSDEEVAFGWWNVEHSSYAYRGDSSDFAGTTQTIWAIVAATYLSVMGPAGMREVGEGILARTRYALRTLATVPGVDASAFPEASHFMEFPIRFDSGVSVQSVLGRLRSQGSTEGSMSRAHSRRSGTASWCV